MSVEAQHNLGKKFSISNWKYQCIFLELFHLNQNKNKKAQLPISIVFTHNWLAHKLLATAINKEKNIF